SIWRVFILKIYSKKSGTSKVMVIGTEQHCREAIQNFKLSRTTQYKVVSAAFGNYQRNIIDNVDEVDVFYILDMNSLTEEQNILSYLTFNNKRIFLGTNFGNILRINNRIMNIDDESLIAIAKIE